MRTQKWGGDIFVFLGESLLPPDIKKNVPNDRPYSEGPSGFVYVFDFSFCLFGFFFFFVTFLSRISTPIHFFITPQIAFMLFWASHFPFSLRYVTLNILNQVQ